VNSWIRSYGETGENSIVHGQRGSQSRSFMAYMSPPPSCPRSSTIVNELIQWPDENNDLRIIGTHLEWRASMCHRSDCEMHRQLRRRWECGTTIIWWELSIQECPVTG
jgi:hypothetical protein